MTALSLDFSTLKEALQWKEEIGLPALNQVEELNLKIIGYVNQEIVYKSQLNILKNELNERMLIAMTSEHDTQEKIDVSEIQLLHMSNQNTDLIERLDSLENLSIHSESLNNDNMQLRQRNQGLQESNEQYLEINRALISQQIANISKAANLNKLIHELQTELLQINQKLIFVEKQHSLEKENIEAEKLIYKESIYNEYSKYMQMALKQSNDNGISLHQRFKTMSTHFSSNSLISEEGSRPSLFFINYQPESAYFEDNGNLGVILDSDSNATSFDEENKESEENITFIDDISIYEIEIESLTKRLSIRKNEMFVFNEKYKQTTKDLFDMHMLFDKVYAELKQQRQQSKEVPSFYNWCFSCSK